MITLVNQILSFLVSLNNPAKKENYFEVQGSMCMYGFKKTRCKLIMLVFTHVVFVKDFIDHNEYNLSLQQNQAFTCVETY